VAKVCTNCGKVLPFSNQGGSSYGDSFEAANQTRKGLSDLRNAFLLYFVAGILSLVPIIGAIGGLVNLVGLILLIIGWRALGRSSLRGNASYKSAGSWLLYAIIIVIVVGIIGIFVLAFSAVSTFASNPSLFQTNSTTTNSTAILQSPAFRQTITQIIDEGIGLGAILAAIWFSVWIWMLVSLRKLGSELSEPKITLGANLYLVQIVITVTAGLAAIYFVFQQLLSNLTSPSVLPNFAGVNSTFAPYSYVTLGGYWTLLFLVSIAGSIVQIVGSYLIYAGLGAAALKIPAATSVPPPPPFPGTAQSLPLGTNSFCPQCGRPISDATNFCPYCGSKLKP
jgi:hypothetical protein